MADSSPCAPPGEKSGLSEWLERAVAPPLVERCTITPAVAAEVAALPATFHRDPADRILVATARVHGATLLTADERIRAAGLAIVREVAQRHGGKAWVEPREGGGSRFVITFSGSRGESA